MCFEERSMKLKPVMKTICFLLIFVVLFTLLQNIFTPDHNSQSKAFWSISGFYELPEDSIDVLFLGSSLMQHGISPMTIYETSGIKSYNFAGYGAGIGVCCARLEYALERQMPKLVVLDASLLFTGSAANSPWRYTLDNIPLSLTKLKLAQDYDECMGNASDGVLSIVIPMIKYHSRWNELNGTDFINRKPQLFYANGYCVDGRVMSSEATIANIDAIATEVYSRNPAAIPKIDVNSLAYLRRIEELCQINDINLMLIRLPGLVFPQNSGRVCWSRFTHDKTMQLADELGLPFLDLNYDVDPEIDFRTDSWDGGNHLNISGAEKVSKFLGPYLTEHYDLDHEKNLTWEGEKVLYDLVRSMAMLQATLDFRSYLSQLAENLQGRTILITAKEEYTSGLTEEDFALFEKLGLTSIREGGFTDSYLAVIRDGIVEHEEVSNNRLYYQTNNGNTLINMVSSGWYSTSLASVNINGVEYAMNSNGLNIVVWDNETALPLDSASVNTRYSSSKLSHHSGIYGFLLGYEEYLMENASLGSLAG